MKFYFLSKGVEMYCTVFFIIIVGLLFFSHPEVSFFLRTRGFYLKRNDLVAQGFLWMILLCLQSVHPIVFSFPR